MLSEVLRGTARIKEKHDESIGFFFFTVDILMGLLFSNDDSSFHKKYPAIKQ